MSLIPQRFPNVPVSSRAWLVALHDIVMAGLSFEFTVWLRYYTYGVPQPLGFLWEGTLIFAAVAAISFAAFGLYRGIWYYASLPDLIAIIKAVALASLVFLPLLFAINRLDALPRSVLLINAVVLVLLLAVPRFLYRLIKDGNLAGVFERANEGRVPVLLAGISDAADTFIRAMLRRRAPYRVVGLIDKSPGRVGRDVRGIRVLGTFDQLDEVVGKLAEHYRKPQRLIITSDQIPGPVVQELLEKSERLGMTLARLPRLTDFRRNDPSLADADAAPRLEVRPVDIEDLLGRTQRVLDRDAMARLVEGRRVLVTGAGGTIGGELVRQVAALKPARLALLDNGEFNLYQIDLELAEREPGVTRTAYLADVRQRARLAEIFTIERPELVFHAAALKHLPLSEINPCEAVLTNVGGTREIAEMSRANGVATMVLVSTDKAVNPSSVMGASKRVAETICQSLELAAMGSATRFVTVRFGNVLGSTGSVVPLFERQLRRGGPLTVTHPEASRYFMTTREAVELILQAAAATDLDARGKIFVLDMGEPVKILDLARQLIRLSGREPGRDVEIAFTGLRSGEKLHEELFHGGEAPVPTALDGIQLAAPRVIDRELLAPQIDRLIAAASAGDVPETLRILRLIVPDYAAVSLGTTPSPAAGRHSG